MEWQLKLGTAGDGEGVDKSPVYSSTVPFPPCEEEEEAAVAADVEEDLVAGAKLFTEATQMHNTEVKTETVTGGEAGVQTMTNGDIGVSGVASRHHRGGSVEFSGSSCAGCGKRIVDRFLLKALDMFWHEDCLKCGCCDCRLGEVGSTLYTKANLILCKRDYLRLFGNTGYCAACSKVIPAFEMVMRARANVYHLECFACQVCNHRFCVGDKFYLCENKILCEYDYEERMVFANMAYSPGNLAMLRNNQDSKSNSSIGSIINSNSNSLPPKLQSLSPSSMGHHQQPMAQRTAT